MPQKSEKNKQKILFGNIFTVFLDKPLWPLSLHIATRRATEREKVTSKGFGKYWRAYRICGRGFLPLSGLTISAIRPATTISVAPSLSLAVVGSAQHGQHLVNTSPNLYPLNCAQNCAQPTAKILTKPNIYQLL